jgi:molybdate transport system permease protein
VPDWSCELHTAAVESDALTHVGIRSHQVVFQIAAEGLNTFPCWLADTSEAPHEMTLYLHLHSAAQKGDLPHLQVDISKDTWLALRARPQPWHVQFDPARLLLAEG